MGYRPQDLTEPILIVGCGAAAGVTVLDLAGFVLAY